MLLLKLLHFFFKMATIRGFSGLSRTMNFVALPKNEMRKKLKATERNTLVFIYFWNI